MRFLLQEVDRTIPSSLVYSRLTPSSLIGCTIFTGAQLYSRVQRGTVNVTYLALSGHQIERSDIEPGSISDLQRTNH